MLDIESSALIDLLSSEFSASMPGLKEHFQEVTEECERSGKPAFEVIENFGRFTREMMLKAMADNLGTYIWDPKSGDIPKDVIGMIDLNTARTQGVIPVSLEDGTLYVAMRKPLDYQTVESLRFILNCNVVPVVCDPDQFDVELDRYYPEKTDGISTY